MALCQPVGKFQRFSIIVTHPSLCSISSFLRVGSSRGAQILRKPRKRSLLVVAAVLWLREAVAFACVNDQLGRHAMPSERPPELIGLRHWALDIVLADQDKRRGLHVLDEVDRRTLSVNGRIVVH